MLQRLSLTREMVEIVSGIRAVADGLVEEFKRLLPWQPKWTGPGFSEADWLGTYAAIGVASSAAEPEATNAASTPSE